MIEAAHLTSTDCKLQIMNFYHVLGPVQIVLDWSKIGFQFGPGPKHVFTIEGPHLLAPGYEDSGSFLGSL